MKSEDRSAPSGNDWTVSLENGILTGEKGKTIPVSTIRSIRTYWLFNTFHVEVKSAREKILIKGTTTKIGKVEPNLEGVMALLASLKSEITHDVDYIEGSNGKFNSGLLLFGVCLCLVAAMLIKGELPRHGAGRAIGTLVGLFVFAGTLLKGGRAKKVDLSDQNR